jgi:hypothetical protein
MVEQSLVLAFLAVGRTFTYWEESVQLKADSLVMFGSARIWVQRGLYNPIHRRIGKAGQVSGAQLTPMTLST